MAYVTIRLKGVEGHTKQDLEGERLVLGRSSAAEISIKHTSISREHAAFVRDGDGWAVEDLGSSNGTWVNADRIAGRTPLKERDIVKAGQARLTFHLGARVDDGGGAGDGAIDIQLDDEPKAPVRAAGAEDPPEAAPCSACGAWFSIAHRLAGDVMECPRCGIANTVPSMGT